MIRKFENNYKCPKNILLLLFHNLKYKGKRYVLKKGKHIKTYNIPAKLLFYINDNTINIIINISLENNDIIKKDNVIAIDLDCSKVIDDFGYSFYMNYFNEKIESNDLLNQALFGE